MATRSATSLSLKKKSGSLHQRSTNFDIISSKRNTGVLARSMSKATTATVTKREVTVASSHSCDSTDSNVYDKVSKIPSIDPLKGKSTPELKMRS